MNAGEGEVRLRELNFPIFFVRVAGGHEQRSVDFEAPGTALDGPSGGKFGEVTGEVIR